jgi:hypothetical protein
MRLSNEDAPRVCSARNVEDATLEGEEMVERSATSGRPAKWMTFA